MIHDTFLTKQELVQARQALSRSPLAMEVGVGAVLQPARRACGFDLVVPPPTEFRFPVYHSEHDGRPLSFDARDISGTRDAHGRPVRGPGPDRAWMNLVHNTNANDARTCALAGALFDDQPCLDRARRIVFSYADAYADYFPTGRTSWTWGKVTCSGLEESIWLLSMLWAAELLEKCGQLSNEEVDRLRVGLFEPGADLLWGDVPRIHNIRMWNNAAVGCIGFAFADRAAIRQAVFGEYGFRQQTVDGFTPDGMQYEGSPGYHDYGLTAMLFLAEAMARNGMRPYQETLLRQALSLPFALMQPDGRMPALNDCWSGTTLPTRLYGTAALRYPDTQMRAWAGWAFTLWRERGYTADTTVSDWNHTPAYYGRQQLDWLLVLDSLPLGQRPATPDAVSLPQAGVVVARPTPADYVLLKASRKGSGHDHHDKLSLIFWSRGKCWLEDKGSGSYGATMHESWFKTTLAHNAVTVDGLSHERCDGALEACDASALAGRARPYPSLMTDVVLRRRVVLKSSDNGLHARDVVVGEADRPRTFDYVLHPRGRLLPQGHTAEPMHAPLASGVAYRHLSAVNRLKLGAQQTLTFEQDGAHLTLDLSVLPSSAQVYTALAPCEAQDETKLGHVVIIRLVGREAHFEVGFTATSAAVNGPDVLPDGLRPDPQMASR